MRCPQESAAPPCPTSDRPGLDRRAFRALAGTLVLILVARVVTIAWDKSACNDEPKHLLTGVAYLANGWCCLGSNNTAFAAWSALPELFLGAPEPAWGGTATHWRYFRARLMNLPLVVLLALYVGLWARRLFGRGPALLSLALLCSCPNTAAHAALVSPDFHVTALVLPATYHARLLLADSFRCGRFAVAALFFFLAQVAKYTALFLVPVLLLVSGVVAFAGRRPLRDRAAKIGLTTGVMVAGFLLVAVVYDGPRLILGVSPKDVAERGLGTRGLEFELLRMPLPPDKAEALLSSGRHPTGYLAGLRNAQQVVEHGYAAYLNGVVGPPRLAYYPETFLLKTPIASLILFAIGILGLLGAWRRLWLDGLLLLLPVVALWGVALTSSIQLGLRHLLPIYPFLFVVAGAASPGRSVVARGLVTLLVAWQAWAAVQSQPHALAYFNEIAGGPSHGHRYLVYENLDWGQDLRRLAAFQAVHATGPIALRYFGSIRPDLYGVQSHYMPLGTPMSGWLAVSRTRLMAEVVPPFPESGPIPLSQRGFAWLDPFRPVAILGHSILVYHITDDDLSQLGMARQRR
ncbi:MAG: hypothetical protein AB1486_02075 [Planctomycetota bacterium]